MMKSFSMYWVSLAGMKLTFFMPVHRVLWFAFVANRGLISHQCFACCCMVLALCQVFLFSPLWNRARTDDPNRLKICSTSYNITFGNKSSGEGGGRGDTGYGTSLPKQPLWVPRPCFPEWLDTCLPMGHSK